MMSGVNTLLLVLIPVGDGVDAVEAVIQNIRPAPLIINRVLVMLLIRTQEDVLHLASTPVIGLAVVAHPIQRVIFVMPLIVRAMDQLLM
jgi:hypothetical protein